MTGKTIAITTHPPRRHPRRHPTPKTQNALPEGTPTSPAGQRVPSVGLGRLEPEAASAAGDD